MSTPTTPEAWLAEDPLSRRIEFRYAMVRGTVSAFMQDTRSGCFALGYGHTVQEATDRAWATLREPGLTGQAWAERCKAHTRGVEDSKRGPEPIEVGPPVYRCERCEGWGRVGTSQARCGDCHGVGLLRGFP